MAAPAFGTAGTQVQTTASTMNVDVPDSVAAGDIIVVTVFIETTGGDATVTGLATDFAFAPDGQIVVSGGNNHRQYVMWKRATGADSTAGTYDFTLSSSHYFNAQAIRYTGAVGSGDPWDVTNSAESGATSGTVTPAVSDTTTVADTLLIWSGTNWSGGSWTPPTSFTERRDTGDGVCTVADLAQAAAGATGSITGTCTSSDRRTAWLGALKSEAVAVDSSSYSPARLPGRVGPDGRVFLPNRFDDVTSVAPSTNAPAGGPTATGTADQPIARVSALAGLASGDGTAGAPISLVRPSAGVASGAGAAPAPTPDIDVFAGLAAGTGTAPQPTVSTSASTNAPAGLASGSGTAFAPVASVVALPAAPTGAGTANTATALVGARPNAPTGAGTADGQTVTTAAFTNAPAGLASATGTAFAPTALVRPNPGVATGTGTANQPAALVRPTAGVGVGAGAAPQPTVLVVKTAFAGLAAGSGTAGAPTVAVRVLAGVAVGAGTAPQPVGQGELPVEPISDPLELAAVEAPHYLGTVHDPLTLDALED